MRETSLTLEWLCKGAGHKYLRRIPTGDPKRKWRYIYAAQSKHHDSEFSAGEKIRITHGKQVGHYEVKSLHGAYVTLKHDETGHEVSVHKDRLAQMFKDEHRRAGAGQRKMVAKTAAKTKAAAVAQEAYEASKQAKTSTGSDHERAAELHTKAADAGAEYAALHRELAVAHKRAAQTIHARAKAKLPKQKFVLRLERRPKPGYLGTKQQAWDVLMDSVSGETPGDFHTTDAKYQEWKRRGGQKPPPYTGGELDTVNDALGLFAPDRNERIRGKKDPRVSSLREGFERLTANIKRWDDPRMKDAIDALRGVDGLSRVRVPGGKAGGGVTRGRRIAKEEEAYYRETSGQALDTSFDPDEVEASPDFDTSFDFGFNAEAAKSMSNDAINDIGEYLEKAHKYVKRTGTPGNYQYEYETAGGQKVSVPSQGAVATSKRTRPGTTKPSVQTGTVKDIPGMVVQTIVPPAKPVDKEALVQTKKDLARANKSVHVPTRFLREAQKKFNVSTKQFFEAKQALMDNVEPDKWYTGRQILRLDSRIKGMAFQMLISLGTIDEKKKGGTTKYQLPAVGSTGTTPSHKAAVKAKSLEDLMGDQQRVLTIASGGAPGSNPQAPRLSRESLADAGYLDDKGIITDKGRALMKKSDDTVDDLHKSYRYREDWANKFQGSPLYIRALQIMKERAKCSRDRSEFEKQSKSYSEVEELPRSERNAYRAELNRARKRFNEREERIDAKADDLDVELLDQRIAQEKKYQETNKSDDAIDALSESLEKGKALPSDTASVSPTKARQILHDGEVHGKPITDQQRKFFGAIGGHLPAPGKEARKSMDSIDAMEEFAKGHGATVGETVTGSPQKNFGEAGALPGDNAAGAGPLPRKDADGGAGLGSGTTGRPPAPNTSGEAPGGKLSEDDEVVEEQMTDRPASGQQRRGSQLMMGRYRKSVMDDVGDTGGRMTPSVQLEDQAHDRAVAISKLHKSDDVAFGASEPQVEEGVQVYEKASHTRVGELVHMSNVSDLEVERMQKASDFYHGAPPDVGVAANLRKSQPCVGGGDHRMSAHLTTCDTCGAGRSGGYIGAGIELQKSGRGLAKPHHPDLDLSKGLTIPDDEE